MWTTKLYTAETDIVSGTGGGSTPHDWTGLEPSPYQPHFQYFNCLQKYNSRITRLFFATV